MELLKPVDELRHLDSTNLTLQLELNREALKSKYQVPPLLRQQIDP